MQEAVIYPVPKPAPKQRSGASFGGRAGFNASKLPRSKPLARHTWMPRKRKKPRRGPWRSSEYRAQVRTLPCCAPGAPIGCGGRITCSHLDQGLKEKGMGMKTGDQNSAPHCEGHNDCWDNRHGCFRGWTNEEREFYADEAIHETQVLLGYRSAA